LQKSLHSYLPILCICTYRSQIGRNGRDYGYYKGQIVDVDDYIGNDLVKYGHAELSGEDLNKPIAEPP